jgi:tRNA-guanine family transglycosylase
MGRFVNFCAGVNDENSLPQKNLEGILINVPNSGKNDRSLQNTRNFINGANPEFVMLDSGGYSLFVKEEQGKSIYCDPGQPIYFDDGINLTPTHVINVAREINPHILVALDFPIATLSEKNAHELEFRKKLGFNLTWAIETARLHAEYCPQINLFIPIQCYHLDHLEEFLYLTRDINHENLCMPVRNLTLQEISDFMLRFYQKGVKRVHLLGVGSFYQIALAAYLARNYFDWVSVDATTWRMEGGFGKYLNPHDLSRENIGQKITTVPDIEMDCLCPWCQYETFASIHQKHPTDMTAFLMRHNFWVTNHLAHELYDHADSLWNFRNYLMKQAKRKDRIRDLYFCLSKFELAVQKPAA